MVVGNNFCSIWNKSLGIPWINGAARSRSLTFRTNRVRRINLALQVVDQTTHLTVIFYRLFVDIIQPAFRNLVNSHLVRLCSITQGRMHILH